MNLEELLTGATHLTISRAAGNPEIRDIQFDSRAVRNGTLFVALVGAATDGHRFVRRAVEMGAAAVVVDQERAAEFADLDVPVCSAIDTRAILGELAARFFGDPSNSMKLIGVTGTNGKTTVTFLIEAVLRHAGVEAGVLGTVNYRWPGHVLPAANTTPESATVQRLLAQMRDDGVDAVAMEVSSHGLSTHRLEGTLFDVGVFTNLSQDHLDFHATMEDYRDAKAQLFVDHLQRAARAGKRAVAVLNLDDEEGRRLAGLVDAPVELATYSAAGQDAHWCCRAWEQTIAGTRMTIAGPQGDIELQTRLLGAFNVANVLATIAACDAIGVGPEVAAEALAELRGVPGRLQHFGGGEKPDVFVDYAHTPDALARALDALRPLTQRRLVAVFGCGGDRDRDKRSKMGAAARDAADFVVLTNDNPRTEDPDAIIAAIAAAFDTPSAALDSPSGWTAIAARRDAIERAIAHARPGDVILIAGKGHETYQEVNGVRHDFDDAAVVAEALRT